MIASVRVLTVTVILIDKYSATKAAYQSIFHGENSDPKETRNQS